MRLGFEFGLLGTIASYARLGLWVLYIMRPYMGQAAVLDFA